MLSMTPRQKQAYDFIRSFIDQKGYGPSYEKSRRRLACIPSLVSIASLKGLKSET
ncbi:hypothetical protein HED49_03155 [Ochrobactrum daejeonense]|nr:hypothetical protein [Brucella daejeonensis]